MHKMHRVALLFMHKMHKRCNLKNVSKHLFSRLFDNSRVEWVRDRYLCIKCTRIIILPYHTNKAGGKASPSSETRTLKLKSGLVLERDLGTAFNRVIPYVPKNHPSDSYGEANREVLENGTSGTGMTTDRLFLVEAAI